MKRAAPLLLLALLAGCHHRDGTEAPVKDGVGQTLFPGMVTAGGHTSGEVFARTSKAGAVEPGPAGTPGIPKGAEGNVGGTNLGATAAAPASGAGAGAAVPAAPASAAAAAASAPAAMAAVAALPPASGASTVAMLPASAPLKEADRQARELALSIDLVAARWRAHAAASGLPVHGPTAIAAAAPAASAPVATAPVNVRSEKIGNVAPTPDAKTATKPADAGGVQSHAPKAASPRP